MESYWETAWQTNRWSKGVTVWIEKGEWAPSRSPIMISQHGFLLVGEDRFHLHQWAFARPRFFASIFGIVSWDPSKHAFTKAPFFLTLSRSINHLLFINHKVRGLCFAFLFVMTINHIGYNAMCRVRVRERVKCPISWYISSLIRLGKDNSFKYISWSCNCSL